MTNPYEVILWKRNWHTGCAEPIAKRRFKTLFTAEKWAIKLNDKHCQVTKYQYHDRRKSWVDIYKKGKGCIIEIEPVIVPSVGELGYW